MFAPRQVDKEQIMDAVEPPPYDLLPAGRRDLGAANLSSTARPTGATRSMEVPPSEALRAKLGQLAALRDRGLLSSEELRMATARLLGL